MNTLLIDFEARNVLLLTLIIDNPDKANDPRLWNIYHHVYIDDDSLQLICSQAKKLATLATSIDTWDAHAYSGCLKFCDEATLEDLADIWRSYDVQALTAEARLQICRVFESELRRAIDYKKEKIGQNQVLTGFRSAAPASIASLDDVSRLYHQFWETGKTDATEITTPHINPMFAAHLTGSATLHYGTDPLLGFHLSTAYVPLRSASQLRPAGLQEGAQKVVKAAQLQFRLWAQAFREKVQTGLLVRFFAGEALRFCHALRLRRSDGSPQLPNMYRRLYDPKPLVLGSMYKNGEAPTSFNVIDTSNLMDHVSSINLLVAAAPLLDHAVSATLYTESLVRKHKSTASLLDEALCGHFPTMTILLGLFPTEYWTNATGVSSVDEAIIEELKLFKGKADAQDGQLYSRLAWHRPPIETDVRSATRLEIAATDIARVLYQVYLRMFQFEDVKRFIGKSTFSEIQSMSSPAFHRGSFVMFLSYIRARVAVDWGEVIRRFFEMLDGDTTLLIGPQYLQELFTMMHVHNIHTVDVLRFSSHDVSAVEPPPVLSVTLKVPRSRLTTFTRRPLSELGTPPVLCVVQSSNSYDGKRWQNFFACVHMMFGKITTVGVDSADSLQVSVEPDTKGWSGNSDLIVCFYAPRWTLFQEPDNASISLRLQNAPFTQMLFMEDLGMELMVYETTLGNRRNVFISKYWPNHTGLPSIHSSWPSSSSSDSHHEDHSTSMVPVFSSIEPKCEALKGRISLHSLSLKSILKDSASVEVAQKTPTTSAISIKGFAKPITITFPSPVVISKCKTRIARTSSYVEIEAPVYKQRGQGEFPFFAFPLKMGQRNPIVMNLPCLQLSKRPVIETKDIDKIQWIITHVSLAFSSRERKWREAGMPPGAPPAKDARVNFKDGLFSMFMHFTGLQGQKARAFGLSNPDMGGISILIFVSELRLDTANHTVILDSAVLPLTPAICQRLGNSLGNLEGSLCQIKVDEEEMKLWRYLIPAFVERARLFEHKASCEYRSQNDIPISFANGSSPICSCGKGQLPQKFMRGIPGWERFAKHCTRIAISPLFASPLVELSANLTHLREDTQQPYSKANGTATDACGKCGKHASVQGVKLMSCVRCRSSKYCSKECQKLDWKEHKKICGV